MERSPFSDHSSSSMNYPGQPPSGGSRTWMWIVGVVVVLGLVSVCCCGGLAYFGLQIVTEEIAEQLRYDPTVLEHVGEVEEFSINWTRSTNEDSEDVFVYDVKGTKGSGVITCEHVTGEDGDEEILWAELKLPDGRTFDLDVD